MFVVQVPLDAQYYKNCEGYHPAVMKKPEVSCFKIGTVLRLIPSVVLGSVYSREEVIFILFKG